MYYRCVLDGRAVDGAGENHVERRADCDARNLVVVPAPSIKYKGYKVSCMRPRRRACAERGQRLAQQAVIWE